MNRIWGIMILFGIGYGMAAGRAEAVTEAVLESAREAVSLCIATGGVVALWTGLMEIAQEAGVIRVLVRKVQPVIRFLFPDIPKGHPAGEHITLNFVANFLGLGWAATPAGLRAMEALEELEETRRAEGGKRAVPRGTASREMCAFLILNISSLQLLPVNVIAFRSQYGSAAPARIIGPGIAATLVSTGAAVLFCRIKK